MAEKQERRSIADAMNMSTEALAFIKGRPEKVVDVKPDEKKSVTTGREDRDQSDEQAAETFSESREPNAEPASKVAAKGATETPRRRTYRSIDQRAFNSAQQDLGFGMNNLLVPLTTRLQPSTAAALKRAGLEQKLRGQQPSTVQEIAEIAIQGWLRQNGFLN